jgi:hypothetical protein
MALGELCKVFSTVLQNPQKLEISCLIARTSISNFKVSLSLTLNLYICFSNCFQMTLTELHMGFLLILQNHQKYEISYLAAQMTKINVWVPSSLYQFLFIFLKWFQSIFKGTSKNLDFFIFVGSMPLIQISTFG